MLLVMDTTSHDTLLNEKKERIESWFINLGVDASKFEISDELNVTLRSFHFQDKKVKSMPFKQLNVIGENGLVIIHCDLLYLPEKLTITNSLYIQDTPIQKLPDQLSMFGSSADIHLFNTNLIALPEKFSVTGNLEIVSSPLSKLPDNLTVKGSLVLLKTSVKTIPENLRATNIILDNPAIEVPLHLQSKVFYLKNSKLLV